MRIEDAANRCTVYLDPRRLFAFDRWGVVAAPPASAGAEVAHGKDRLRGLAHSYAPSPRVPRITR